MPSRRSYLAGLATAGVVGLAGCSEESDRMTGTVYSKMVVAAVPPRQEDYWTVIGSMTDSINDQTVVIKSDPMYVTVDTGAVEMTLTDEQQDLLDQNFGEFELSFTIVPKDADGGPRRPDFNEVRVGGEATVSEVTGDDGASYHRLHDTDQRSAELSISQFIQHQTDHSSR